MISELHRKFGGNVNTRKPRPPRKAVHLWTLSGDNAARFLSNILPYLVCKYEQASVAIDARGYQSKSGWTMKDTPERAEKVEYLSKAAARLKELH
jgi:hypothetical protein